MNICSGSDSEHSDVDDAVIVVSFLNLCKMYQKLKAEKKRRRRRWYTQPINRDWLSSGYFQKVFKKLNDMDDEHFFLHTRMTKDSYDLLLSIVKSPLRKPFQRVSPEERISITLLYLAHGNSIQSIAWSYKLGKTTIRNIILETCDVLWRLLSPIYVNEPTADRYINIENDFDRKWNISNCVGVIDAKHIALKGSSDFGIILMGVCDANYVFTAVSVGSKSDGGIFCTCPFGQSVLNNTIPLPAIKPLTSSSTPFPYYFVGGAAFPLRPNLMRPYPQTNIERHKIVFNYRLSRAQRVIENTFGVLSARWKILLTTLECSPDNCKIIVLACVALHNFIMHNSQQLRYCPHNFVDCERLDGSVDEGDWRTEIRDNGACPLKSMTNHIRRSTETAVQLRNQLAEYFCNAGLKMNNQDLK